MPDKIKYTCRFTVTDAKAQVKTHSYHSYHSDGHSFALVSARLADLCVVE